MRAFSPPAVTAAVFVLAGLMLSLTRASGEEPVPIDGGFAYADMEFAVAYPNEVLGTMFNRSGRNYTLACFIMKLYNKSDQLLKTVDFCVSNIANGQSRSFRTSIRMNPEALKGYKILFRDGR